MSDLAPEWRVGSVVLTEAPFAVARDSSVDYGAPENVTELIRSLLQDGDVELSTRTGNRTLSLPVLIEDADLAALADAEAALVAECDKFRNEVYVDPGDGFAEPFIFDVFRGQLTFTRDDVYEQHGYRSYVLTFRALPHSRSTTEASSAVTLATVGTARQGIGSFTAQGSAGTEASLAVEHTSSALGNVLLYTWDDDGEGHSPPLRPLLTSSGATTADAALVSGARNMLDTAMVFDIPAETLPEGLYVLMARMRGSGVGSAQVTATAETRVNGVGNLDADIGAPTLEFGTDWLIYVLGTVSLPIVDVGDQATADVRVTIVDDDASGIDVDLDEAWLFNLSAGALTQVNCEASAPASGGASKRLFLEPPSLDHPTGRFLRGHASDQSDAFYAPARDATALWGRHALRGGGATGVFVMTENATGATVAQRHWRRWQTHAGS